MGWILAGRLGISDSVYDMYRRCDWVCRWNDYVKIIGKAYLVKWSGYGIEVF